MNETFQHVKEYVYPQEKSIPERCVNYVKENPGTVVKGVAITAAAFLVVPTALSVISWAPWLGAGYYVYSTSRKAQDGFSWARYAQEKARNFI